MSEDLAVVERRTAAVAAVRQVVQALLATAQAQLPAVEELAADTAAYLDWLDETVDRLAGPPLRGAPRAVLHVVIGPERPYCGALPNRIVEQLPEAGDLVLVGARLEEIARPTLGARVVEAVHGASSADEAAEVARSLAATALAHGADRQVDLLHPRGGSHELARVVLLSGERGPSPSPPQTYSPLATVLHGAVVEAVRGRLVVGVAEGLMSEIRARVAAADRARQACDRALEDLRGAFRVLRQEEITREILEVTGAAAASIGARGGAR